MIKSYLRFVALLILTLSIAFITQGYIQHNLGIGFYEKHILLCYAFNFLITAFFYFILLVLKARKSTQLGYVFFFSSMLKFLLFFIFIKPLFLASSGVKSPEFFAFFIPYGVSVILEIYMIIRSINREELQ